LGYGDRRFGRQASLGGRRVVRADDPPGLLDAVLVPYEHRRAEADQPAGGLRRLLDDHGGGDLLAQAGDLRLQVRLLVLGVVILAVLLQIAPLACGLDPLGHLAPAVALERCQFGVERLQARCGHHVRGVGH